MKRLQIRVHIDRDFAIGSVGIMAVIVVTLVAVQLVGVIARVSYRQSPSTRSSWLT